MTAQHSHSSAAPSSPPAAMFQRALTRVVPSAASSASLARCIVAAVRPVAAFASVSSSASSSSSSFLAVSIKPQFTQRRHTSFWPPGDAAPPPEPASFRPKEEIDSRIHRLIFDLFTPKLETSSVYELPPSPESTPGTASSFRVDADVPFKQLGLDSLDLVELMVAVEREFHIELEDKDHARVQTVDDIATIIHEHPRAY